MPTKQLLKNLKSLSDKDFLEFLIPEIHRRKLLFWNDLLNFENAERLLKDIKSGKLDTKLPSNPYPQASSIEEWSTLFWQDTFKKKKKNK